jgi:hypothetical protein
MLDELHVLQGSEYLSRLLAHYALAGATNQESWQDRVMELGGVERHELIKLHGKLIAFGWIEQNTGAVPILQQGCVPQSYRVTGAGLRALKIAETKEEDMSHVAFARSIN